MAGTAAVLAMIVLMGSAVAVGQGVKEYKFTNNTGRKANDLHIKFKDAVSWPEHEPPKQDPADTFRDANGRNAKKVGLAAGHTGKGVEDGNSVVITFSYAGDKPPTVEQAWWTFTNDACWQEESRYYQDPNKAIRIPAKDLASAWSGGRASGDGLYAIMIDGQQFRWRTVSGDLPEQTAQRFAQFIANRPWGHVIEVQGSRASFTGLSYSNAWPNVEFLVMQQDRRQPVEVMELVDEPCVGDTNGDRSVDQADLATVLASFGLSCPAEGYNADADLNDDGRVDQADLATLLANFGNRCL